MDSVLSIILSSYDPVVMILVAQDKILVPRSLGRLAYHHLVIETDPLIQQSRSDSPSIGDPDPCWCKIFINTFLCTLDVVCL